VDLAEGAAHILVKQAEKVYIQVVHIYPQQDKDMMVAPADPAPKLAGAVAPAVPAVKIHLITDHLVVQAAVPDQYKL